MSSSPSLPTRVPGRSSTNRCILAIGSDADDLEMTLGGTLSKYRAVGYSVGYVMTTNNHSGLGFWKAGDLDPSLSHPANIMRIRKSEADAAAEFYGTKAIHLDHPQRHYDLGDGKQIKINYGVEPPPGVDCSKPCILTAHEDTASVQRVTDLIIEHNAEAIFTHGMPIVNIEHFATMQLVAKAYWKAVEMGYEGMLLAWPDVGVYFGEAWQQWNTFVDITGHFQAKLDATRIHASTKPEPEKLDWPEYGPACGCAHAEVFTIISRNRRNTQYGPLTLELLENER